MVLGPLNEKYFMKIPEIWQKLVFGVVESEKKISATCLKKYGKNCYFQFFNPFSLKRPYLKLYFEIQAFQQGKKIEEQQFLTYFFKQVAEIYFSLSTTPNTSFYQVSGVFMQYFSFYGPETIQKWSFFGLKTPKIHAKALQYLKNYMEF